MKGNMGAHLHVVRTKYVARSHKYTTAEEASSLPELDEAFDTGAVMRRKVRAMQESRIARVEALRAQVRAGTYQGRYYPFGTAHSGRRKSLWTK